MEQEKLNRRTQKTRQLLIDCFMVLLEEKDYNKITIQDITDKADLGRTTFYTHFENKEDLYLYSHHDLFHELNEDIFVDGGKLNTEVSQALVHFLTQITENRNIYFFIAGIKSEPDILQRIIEGIATHLEDQLKEHRNEEESRIPFVVLSHYLAGAMMALINWWVAKKSQYSAPELAAMLHRLRNAALKDSLIPTQTEQI